MRALVTGGAGFIGSHLVDALVARGDDVVVLDDFSTGRREHVNAAATLLEHDVRDAVRDGRRSRLPPRRAGRRRHVDGAAGVRCRGERGRHGEHARGRARRRGAPRLLLDRRRDLRRRREPAREESPLLPVSAYGLAKRSAEVYVDGWSRVFGSAHVVLRFANVYGPRQSAALEGGVIAIFLERLAAGRPTAIFGDGEQTRATSSTSTTSSARCSWRPATGAASSTSGPGSRRSISELHAVCQRAVGVEAPPNLEPPRAGDAQRSVLDPARAARELGFTVSVTLADGIAATLASGD